MAVQQHRGGNPWDFADDIGSAVDTAIDMHYRDKKDARDEEKYQDNKMLTMFQMEDQSLQQSYKNSMEMMEFLKDPDLQMNYMAGPEWTNLSQNMSSLRDRQRDYFRTQGMPEDEISAKTSHLNLNSVDETFKDAMAPRKFIKDIYNKYYNPLTIHAGDLTKQGYNPNTIRALTQKWRQENPDADYTEFFEQDSIQKWLMNEEDAWGQFNAVRVDAEYRKSYQGSAESGHQLATNIQTVGEHSQTINNYITSLLSQNMIDETVAEDIRKQIGESAMTGDIGQYKRALDNINTTQTDLAMQQKRYNDARTLEQAHHASLVQLGVLEKDNGSISQATQTLIAESNARLKFLNQTAPTGVQTTGTGSLLGNNNNNNNNNNNRLDDGLTTWSSPQSIPRINTAMNSLFENNKDIFGDSSFNQKMANEISRGKRIKLNTDNGMWKVQVAEGTNGKQLGVWGPNNSKGFMFNIGESADWQRAGQVGAITGWDQQGVAGIQKGDILSGPVSTGKNKTKPALVPFVEYGGTDSKGRSILLGVNRNGKPVDHKGDLVTQDNGRKQWKWINDTSGGLFANQSEKEKAFQKSLMRPDVKSHGTINYFDNSGQPLIIQDSMQGNVDNTAITNDVIDSDFGSPDDVEVIK